MFRVRPELHRTPGRAHAPLRRSSRTRATSRSADRNPRNRWILSTNTDMIFVPRDGHGQPDAMRCAILPTASTSCRATNCRSPCGKRFPRSDPQAIMRACEELGTASSTCDEVALRVPYMRFDPPGDFQLMPRQALFDIHGFDERMIARLARRFQHVQAPVPVFRKRTESLAAPREGLPLRPHPRGHSRCTAGYQAREQSAEICLGRRRSRRPAPGRNLGRAQ